MIIYVSTPNKETAKFVCFLLTKYDHVPIMPTLYFPHFTNEDTTVLNEQLLEICDEYWMVGNPTDAMKAEHEKAKALFLPVKLFKDISAMKKYLNRPEEQSEPRSFSTLMGELIRVNDSDDIDEIVSSAYTAAKKLEPRTHIRRETLETILTLFRSVLHDMGKVEITEEEKNILIRGAIKTIAERLRLDEGLVSCVLRMDSRDDPPSEEESAEDDMPLRIITDYVDKQVPLVAGKTNLDRKLVEKILFISNCWRWRSRKALRDGSFSSLWNGHIHGMAEMLALAEDLIKRVLDAEFELLGEEEEATE